jgi:uncharacterized repeat protein (TIGR01451 family)
VATIELIKSAGLPTSNLGASATLVDAGDEITFSFLIRNTGNVSLSAIAVSDPDLGTVTCAASTLAPNATTTCSAPAYVITTADISDGGVENSATVTASSPGNTGDVTDVSDAGTAPDGSTVATPASTETPDIDTVGGDNNDADPTNDPTAVGLSPQPSISLIKFGAPPTVALGADDQITDAGDTIDYSFTVTNTGNVPLNNVFVTDPLVTVSGGPIPTLAPGASDSVTFTATYVVTTADVLAFGVENTATATGSSPSGTNDVSDVSDSGFGSETTNDPDLGEPGDANGTADDDADPSNDPTIIPIPYTEIGLIKSAGTPTVALGANPAITDAGDTIAYTFRVENRGNTVLSNVIVNDPKATVSGGPITLPIGGADTGSFTASYTITVADLQNGGVENTATVTATPSVGPDTMDISDTGAGSETTNDPDLGEPGDANGTADDDASPTNDPTVVLITPAPSVQLTKTALAPTTAQGADPAITDEGDTISYVFEVRNTGNTVLTDLVVTDPKATVVGTAIPSLGIGASDTTTFTANYTITAVDVANGGVENTATVTASSPAGTGDVTDISDTGAGSETTNDPDLGESGDANGTADDDVDPTNDPTVTLFETPRIRLVKSAISVTDTNTDAVIGNAGDTVEYRFAVENIGNVALTNVQVNDPMLGGLVGTIPSIAPFTTETVNGSYVFVTADETRGYVENSATATGTPPSGPAVSDTSDAGSERDLTPISNPEATQTPDGANNTDPDPTNDPTVTTVPLTPSGAAVSGTVYLDRNGNGSYNPGTDVVQTGYNVTLKNAAGDIIATTTSDGSGDYAMSGFPVGSNYSIEFTDPVSGQTVGMLEGLNFGPTTVLTDQDQPIDPAGVFYNSSTGDPVAGVATQLTTAAGVPLPGVCLGAGQQPQITGADGSYRYDVLVGADPLCPAAETEYLIEVTSYPTGFVNGPSTVYPPEAGSLDATTCPIDAVPGGSCQPSASSFAPPAGTTAPYYLSFLLASGDPDVVNNHIPLDPLPLSAGPAVSGLSIAKTAGVSDVVIGDSVPYTITASNANLAAFAPITIVDELPAGMVFTPGSATVDGVAATPTVSGSSIRFSGLTLPAGGTIQIALTTRVTGASAPGEMVNTARLLDGATGIDIAEPATATVIRTVEHVFDCSDIIGKVYDDLNHNGYQDEGEPGLPDVRLSTVDGTLIRTDEHGRYHVPCGALPREIGSNFLLKLDARTLPTGYRVTTENPRVIRVTRGKFAKLNFGASISNIIDIDLTDVAFEAGSKEPKDRLKKGIVNVIEQMRDTPSVIRIAYYTNNESRRLVTKRMDELEEFIRANWKRRGRYKLNIEMTVKVMQ